MEYEPQAQAPQLVPDYHLKFVGAWRGVSKSICHSESAAIWCSLTDAHARAVGVHHRGAGIFQTGQIDPCDRIL